ncbi:MAG TPA: hypothetical protein VGR63_15205 [Casimicrobiaceae bacterium]|jgi:hypothetical protein|nr:hypothetical protein [Casimicrobiaceae bacterium]
MMALLDAIGADVRCGRVDGVLTVCGAPPTGAVTVRGAGTLEPMQTTMALLARIRTLAPGGRTGEMLSALCEAAAQAVLGQIEGVCVLTVTRRGWKMQQAGQTLGLLVEDLGEKQP